MVLCFLLRRATSMQTASEYLHRALAHASRIPGAVRAPFPDRASLRALVVLVLAGLPFFPLGWIPSGIAQRSLAATLMVGALWACADRVFASWIIAREGRLAIRAKQLGLTQELTSELRQLHDSPRSGLLLLVFIVAIVALTLIVTASSVTHGIVSNFDWEGPFRQRDPGPLNVLLYFADEALSGLTFRLCDDLGVCSSLGVSIPAKLEPAGQLWFRILMWGFKAAIGLLTIQVLYLAITSVRAETDPHIVQLAQHIRGQEAKILELKRETMRREREPIFAQQKAQGGRLDGRQRSLLKQQLDYLYGRYLPEFDEIRQALMRHDNLTKKGRGERKGWRRKNREW